MTLLLLLLELSRQRFIFCSYCVKLPSVLQNTVEYFRSVFTGFSIKQIQYFEVPTEQSLKLIYSFAEMPTVIIRNVNPTEQDQFWYTVCTQKNVPSSKAFVRCNEAFEKGFSQSLFFFLARILEKNN